MAIVALVLFMFVKPENQQSGGKKRKVLSCYNYHALIDVSCVMGVAVAVLCSCRATMTTCTLVRRRCPVML